ncbi:hypothetical protein F511_28561 [Dorcoceras hygrometricum]|uniref:Uncharacterized protein n=1 Tax=Dorcoceras hygrometricum TaxID=472368 RepID=A0A2Z7ATA5_9LAMI|nr:hypothetical protein F511_28561 [Dorcoceras hygrometricum]
MGVNHVMSSWTKSSISLRKLHETQKPLDDKSGLGFSFGESSSEETSTQSNLANDKFKKMNFVKASVTHDVCESVKYDDQFTGQLNHKGKNGMDTLSLRTQRGGSTKAKSVWIKVQSKRDLNGQSAKPKLNRSHKISTRTLVDVHTGKTLKSLYNKTKSDEYNGTDVHDKHIIRSALSIQLLTADYLHSMKTSEPRGSADPSILNPYPS